MIPNIVNEVTANRQPVPGRWTHRKLDKVFAVRMIGGESVLLDRITPNDWTRKHHYSIKQTAVVKNPISRKETGQTNDFRISILTTWSLQSETGVSLFHVLDIAIESAQVCPSGGRSLSKERSARFYKDEPRCRLEGVFKVATSARH